MSAETTPEMHVAAGSRSCSMMCRPELTASHQADCCGLLPKSLGQEHLMQLDSDYG